MRMVQPLSSTKVTDSKDEDAVADGRRADVEHEDASCRC